MTNQETDTALILENELKRRVSEVVREIAHDIVRREMREEFTRQKEVMLMEVSITVGKHLRLIENEGRKPLWEATPEEFGLTNESLNTHHLMSKQDALREQTPPI
jgi:DNA topoisomerase VI subunit B